jgi:hypothetical protein
MLELSPELQAASVNAKATATNVPDNLIEVMETSAGKARLGCVMSLPTKRLASQ